MAITHAYAAHSAISPLAPYMIERRLPAPHDVQIDILYCGVCHTDLHFARNEFGFTTYPFVPGHEMVGRVRAVGPAVQRFRVGDVVGVGCMVDSCRECESCHAGEEQYCLKGNTGTYNSPDKHSGGFTFGGYSGSIVVDEGFVLSIPKSLPIDAAAPLLCAGITVYSPLKRWGAGPGKRVGIVGLGGLGHMGVKLAHALEATVVMITSSPEKGADARRLGASEVILSTDDGQMKAAEKSLDLIVNTIAAPHDHNAYSRLLKVGGAQVVLSVPTVPPPPPDYWRMLSTRHVLTSSTIGGIAETQEMLDFCAEHGIACDIETIRMDQINDAYERMLKGDVRYRFVIDMATLTS